MWNDNQHDVKVKYSLELEDAVNVMKPQETVTLRVRFFLFCFIFLKRLLFEQVHFSEDTAPETTTPSSINTSTTTSESPKTPIVSSKRCKREFDMEVEYFRKHSPKDNNLERSPKKIRILLDERCWPSTILLHQT